MSNSFYPMIELRMRGSSAHLRVGKSKQCRLFVSGLREGTDVERASRALVYIGGPEETQNIRELVAA